VSRVLGRTGSFSRMVLLSGALILKQTFLFGQHRGSLDQFTEKGSRIYGLPLMLSLQKRDRSPICQSIGSPGRSAKARSNSFRASALFVPDIAARDSAENRSLQPSVTSTSGSFGASRSNRRNISNGWL
jgi:hypothetical protein